MSFFDKLSIDEQSLLTRLPYRVGLYVSMADSDGGVEAQASEMAALDGIVSAFATEVFGCETIQTIITKTFEHKDAWGKWGGSIINVPEECSRSRNILLRVVDKKEVAGFASHLLDIAEAVAIAFCERGNKLSFIEKSALYFSFMMERSRKGRLSCYSFDTFAYISASEQIALKALGKALEG